MKRTAAKAVRLGLLDALINPDVYLEALERIENRTDKVALFCEETEEKVEEILNGKSKSVY